MKQLQSPRTLVRKRAVHAKCANIAHKLFNCKKSLIISCVDGVELRISPAHSYYQAIKDLLENIGQDHIGKRTFADLAIEGQAVDPEILQKL